MEKIAILRWESGHVPQGLMQLEQLPGNSTNLASYPFPVKLVEVKGANTDTVILHPSQKLLEDMIQLAKELEKEGVRAITTSCGFNAIFQEALANAVDIPVFTSSLLQVPFAQALVGRDRAVGVITASASSLSEKHLRACGITDEMLAEDRNALCAVDGALLKQQAADLAAAMASGVRVVFGSKDAVEAARDLFDKVETL